MCPVDTFTQFVKDLAPDLLNYMNKCAETENWVSLTVYQLLFCRKTL